MERGDLKEMSEERVLLEVKNLTKTYPGVRAVDDISFTLHAGEVMALMGENGVGKSTLIKMIAGSVVPDSGKIIIDGVERKKYSPTVAVMEGIGTIYQELNFINCISIAENIFLFDVPRKGKTSLVDFRALYKKSAEVQEKVGLNRPPQMEVEWLSTGEKQLIEVARAVSQNSKVIIFDEPTSALTDTEVENLYKVIQMLKEVGVGIIYISHKLQEVFQVADSVFVMRDGKYANAARMEEIDQQWIISNMVGRGITNMYGEPPSERVIGEPVLKVEGLENEWVHNIAFELRKGEILGFYGLMGCGSTEIVRALYGADKMMGGRITAFGKEVSIRSTKDALDQGIAYLTNDRKAEGLVLTHSIRQNVCLIAMDQLKARLGVSQKKERALSERWVDSLSIKTHTVEKEAGELSGGNQQKVVLAKFMTCNPKIVIFNEPTRGIDVGTKQEFYKLMFGLLNQGVSIILVSTEMPEVLAMSDRICVVSNGRIKGELTREEATELAVMNLIYRGEINGKSI